MALIIRMRQQGANSRQSFRIVVTDARNPRDGKYNEKLGWYNPFAEQDKQMFLDMPRIEYWIGMGAEVSDRVKALIEKKEPRVLRALGEKKNAKRAKERAARKNRQQKKKAAK